jgi:hypothetical protein
VIKYLTSSYRNSIEQIEVTRETEKCYYIPPRRGTGREIKNLKDRDYHNSWEDAHSYLLTRAISKVESSRLQLSYEENKLVEVQNMQKPV